MKIFIVITKSDALWLNGFWKDILTGSLSRIFRVALYSLLLKPEPEQSAPKDMENPSSKPQDAGRQLFYNPAPGSPKQDARDNKTRSCSINKRVASKSAITV